MLPTCVTANISTVRALSNYGQEIRSQICAFAGLVIVSVANAILVLTVGDEEPAAGKVEGASD